MDKAMQIKLLYAQKKRGLPFKLTVSGVSMNSVLYEGDVIIVTSQEAYKKGDILVFLYNDEDLLVHRLMYIKDDYFYCKGDNALRTEKIKEHQVIGKATSIVKNDEEITIPAPPEALYILSEAVSKKLFKCRLDPVKTRATYIYNLYERKIVKTEDIKVYIKNDNMDFIEADENSITVFDPASGDTHFLDDSSADIIKILENPCDFEKIVSELCNIYEAVADDISEDVKEFLDDAVQKGIIVEI